MSKSVVEEDVVIKSYGEDISKKLDVFYNPEMKVNRDVSLLLIKSYFDKNIKFCDPMAASGIREIRFLKSIGECFSKIVMGDISKVAVENIKMNFKRNNVSSDMVQIGCDNAVNTIASGYFDFVEIDPFGTLVPFLDVAIQRVKHKGILSVTATDTAALCGTYPKKTLRRYGISVFKTLCYEEIGLRNLVAFCQREGAKFDKALVPVVSFSSKHFYKVFFSVRESRSLSYDIVRSHMYYFWDKKTQEFDLSEFELEGYFGKIYVGALNDRKLLRKMIRNSHIIKESKEVLVLIEKLLNEIYVFGYYNVHKLEKEFGFSTRIRFDELVSELEVRGFEVSRVSNNRLGIKTNAKSKDLVGVMKKRKYLN